jgi:hypothetical protein
MQNILSPKHVIDNNDISITMAFGWEGFTS